MSGIHEYAFDVKLAAVVRVWATSEENARSALFGWSMRLTSWFQLRTSKRQC